jgi:hypothetical protein
MDRVEATVTDASGTEEIVVVVIVVRTTTTVAANGIAVKDSRSASEGPQPLRMDPTFKAGVTRRRKTPLLLPLQRRNPRLLRRVHVRH